MSVTLADGVSTRLSNVAFRTSRFTDDQLRTDLRSGGSLVFALRGHSAQARRGPVRAVKPGGATL